jgi:hypothetical protein
MTTAPALSLVLALGAGAAAPPPAAPPPASPLALEALDVQPATPAVDTLCHLTVKVRNNGSQPAASLRFAVSVAGHPLPVYDNQIFMQPLPPGATTEVKLYNFWTTETGRPAPADGKLAVAVSLEEARWLKVEKDADGVEVWQPLDPVPGLPVAKTVTLPLSPAKTP